MIETICQRSFSGKFEGKTYTGVAGLPLTIPEGTDWIAAGFVVAVEKPKPPRKPKVTKKVSK